MNKRKLLVSVSTILLAILVVFLFWKSPYVLILSLVTLALIKGRLSPIKKEVLMFVIGGIVGTGAESIVMFGGPWVYATQSLINFPIWLPFLWGLAGIT